MIPPDQLSEENGQRKHRRPFVLLLVAILALLLLYMVASVLAGLVAGVLLWVMTRKIFEAVLKRFGRRRGLAAGLSVMVTLLVVIVPLTIVVLLATADALRLAGDIQSWIPSLQVKFNEWMSLFSRGGLSLFGYELSPDLVTTKIGELSTTVGQFLLMLTQRTASSVASAILMLFIALYTLYYFYVDGERFIAWFKDTVPLDPAQSQLLIESFFSSSVATLKTIGVIGVVQGVAAGIAYVIIGVPAPFLLTVLTIISTVIPAVGTALIIIPVAIGLFIAGQIGWALALIIWYAVVVSNLDNFLRPYLMHKVMSLHQLVIFVVTLGGIARFGFFGVLIGPVVAALFNASLTIYKDVYARPSEVSDPPVN
jgi:predicted PurR-regulated permease PerM